MDNTHNNKHNHDKEGKPQEANEVILSKQEYEKLKEQADKASEYWDRILRLQADFDNTRKRLDREKQDFYKFANEGIIVELLNILDDLERTLELAQTKHQDLPTFLKGVEMILAHLYDLLKEHGVRPVESVGKSFDPNYHEALMQVEDDKAAEHTILEELQKGYTMNDRVIRTAKVKVSKKA